MVGLSEIAPLVSATVAVISVTVAIAAYALNRRTFKITSRQDRSRQPSVTLYFVKGAIHHFPDLDQRYFDFEVTITNRSDAPNSVAQLRFRLTQRRRGLLSTLEIDPEIVLPVADDLPPSPLIVPRQLAPREVVKARLVFKVPTSLLANRRRERYLLSLTDGHSNVTAARVIILNEHDHDASGNRVEA